MGKLFDYLKLFTQFKDIESEYEQDVGTDHPWYVDQLLIGKSLRLIGAVLFMIFGYQLSDQGVTHISQALPMVIPGLIVIYGEVMNVVASLREKKKMTMVRLQMMKMGSIGK